MNIFNSVLVENYKRNKFILSNSRLTTCNEGQLLPIRIKEVMPGDTHKMRSEIFCRVAPMVSPMFQKTDIYTWSFFCPSRILCNHWEEFLTGGTEGTYNDLLPYVTLADLANFIIYVAYDEDETLYWLDYFGIPNFKKAGKSIDVWVDNPTKVMIQPFIAFLNIYIEYFLNENFDIVVDDIEYSYNGLKHELELLKGKMGHLDYTNNAHFYHFLFDPTLYIKNWSKDYFTSALPFAQRGPAVSIPLVGDAPIDAVVNYFTGKRNMMDVEESDNISPKLTQDANNGHAVIQGLDSEGDPLDLSGKVEGTADLSEASAVTINELRRLTKLQQYLEMLARGGSRLKEMILNVWGEKVPDARLQRPEYLGSGIQPIVVSETLQMSASTDDSPQGNMAGHGVSAGALHGFKKKRFVEHGYIFEILAVLPKATYCQGLPKMFSRFERLDLPIPIFSNLGEMPVLNKELFLGTKDDEGTFGYQSQYADMKCSFDEITGEFGTSLDFWHQGRMFNDLPSLNQEFVRAVDIPQRVFAVMNGLYEDSTHHYWIYIETNHIVKRKLSKYGTPKL